MKYITVMLFIALCFVLSGCVFIDDDCHYETRCSYVCDIYGHNCVADYCWDERICENDYHYYH